jgi:hypothetical protein
LKFKGTPSQEEQNTVAASSQQIIGFVWTNWHNLTNRVATGPILQNTKMKMNIKIKMNRK